VRARARDIERAIAQLEAGLHRAPTDEEIAKKLGITEDELGDKEPGTCVNGGTQLPSAEPQTIPYDTGQLLRTFMNTGSGDVAGQDLCVATCVGAAYEQHFKVYFSVFGDEAVIQEAQKHLTRASGFLHRNLKDRLDLRHIPHLEFILDRSLARGDRIMRLMRTIEEEREHREP